MNNKFATKMKKIDLVKVSCLLALPLMMAGCSGDGDDTEATMGQQDFEQLTEGDAIPNALGLTSEQRALVAPVNDFAFRLFRETLTNDGQNSTVVSPLSAACVLGMLSEGTDEPTRREILTALGADKTGQKVVSDMMQKYIRQSPLVDDAVKFEFANNVTLNNSYELSTAFADAMGRHYDASVFALDFNQPQLVVEAINRWCSEKTHGNISNLIDNIAPETVVCLLNAIYFNGEWTEKFGKSNTRSDKFYASGGELVDIMMMTRTGKAEYCETAGCKALRLPFGQGSFAMTFVLPAASASPADVVKKLDAKAWTDMTFKKEEVKMQLPVFTTNTETDLIPLLKQLGIRKVFTPGECDLSMMTTSERDLFVSLMSQKAQIGIDENGAEASAVTIAELTYGANFGEKGAKIREFIANRPFLYVISDVTSGSIFFIGQYTGK